MRFLRSLKLWQIAIIVVVLLVVALGAFRFLSGGGSSDSANIQEDQQLVPVRRGDLIKQISISGSLSFPNREVMTFGSSGVVAEILVKEGDKVVEGQTLAVLDQEDIAALEQEVVKARVALRDSEKALEDFLEPVKSLDIAQARQQVADAEVALHKAREALDELAEPSQVAVSQAESRIAGYQLELDKAQEALDDLTDPATALELSEARSRVTEARLALERAQDAEDALESDTEDALSDVDAADVDASNALAELRVTMREWDVRLDDARDARDDAAEDYAEEFAQWLGIEVAHPDLDADYEAALAGFGVNLDTMFDTLGRYNELEEGGFYSDKRLPADDPSTAWSESVVFAWLTFSAADIEAACEPGRRSLGQRVCIEEEFRVAASAYETAVDNLANLEVNADKAVSAATSAVQGAQNALERAQKALDELGSAAYAENKRADVELAEARLGDAEEALDDLLNKPPNEFEVEDLEARVESARSNLEQARDELDELLDGRNSEEYAAKLEEVEVARLNLEEKREDLDEVIEDEKKELDRELLEVQIESDKTALSRAEERLSDATMTAPFDGFVSKLDVEKEDKVEANTDVMVVVDTGVVEIDGEVDEIDVLQARVGAEAEVRIDALERRTLRGTVSSIAAEPVSSQGGGQESIVSYPMTVRLAVPEGVELPAGLSAIASITISEELDVLLVPLHALRGRFDSPTLNVIRDGEVVETPVTLGDSDEFSTIVTGGVAEGDMIVTLATEGSEGIFDVTSGPDDGGDGPPRRRR